jgi:hypothetical protein
MKCRNRSLGWFGGPLWNALTASREPGELSTIPGERPHLRSSLAHPTSLALTHRRPLDQSIHPTRVHFGPLASAAKMDSHDGVVLWLYCTRRQVGSKCNSELGSPTFRVSSPFSSTSLTVCRRLQSFILLTSPLNRMLRFHHSLALVLYP